MDINLLNNKDLLNFFIKNDISNNNDDLCLITNNILEENYITLNCNHKFNYIPIYHELIYQKRQKILDNRKLKINEIKCPYCRKITNTLIPYYKYYDVKLITGVNYPEKYCMKINECTYSKNNIKCTNSACKTQYGLYCNKHIKYNINEEEILINTNKDVYNKYKKTRVIDLKNILKENNIKTTGNKEELINRILINIKI